MKLYRIIAALSLSAALSGQVSVCAYALTEDDISAKAAVVIEAGSGQVIYEKNKDMRLPMASTTKIMTALLLIENGGLDKEFTVDSDAIHVEGSSMGLRENDIVTPRALCTGMLLPSGNDAANAAAVYVAGNIPDFVRLMNLRAGVMGLKNTRFVTPSGLHDDGHYSTAYDMARLAAYALGVPEFARICAMQKARVSFGAPPYERTLKNTNRLLGMYAGCIGVKTGFTDEAGRCLVSACERDGVRIVCVTLNDRDDWNDHIRMYDDAFSRTRPMTAEIGELSEPVAGAVGGIAVRAEGKLGYVSVDGKVPDITIKTVMPPFVYAPVTAGEPVGRAELYADGKKVSECILSAAEDAEYIHIEKKTLFERIAEWFGIGGK